MLRCSGPIFESSPPSLYTVVQSGDNSQSPGIPGMVLFNFASREKYIVTIFGNTMPLFASYPTRSKAEQSLHQILRPEMR